MRAGALAFMLSMLPLAAQAETLREALESAYANNPNIMSALLSVKMSAEDIALRKAGKLPQINLEGSVGSSFAVTQGMATTNGDWQLGLSYRQNLFDNFQTESQIEQARAFSELSKYALRNEEQNVLLQVATSYMNVLRDTQLVQLRSDNVAFFEAQVSSSRDRLRLGEGTRIDVSQAESRLAQAVAAYQAAVTSLQTSRASYERWVGHPPRNLSSEFRFGDLIPASVETAIGQAESQNPAILTARASIRAPRRSRPAPPSARPSTSSVRSAASAASTIPPRAAWPDR
jgi:outer membrane protein